ncbi:MAG: stage V sporulation protein AD, partial [Clostridia bacterium]|nr:stage V sporulation protein AD [Clostridia bacterium]
QRPPYSQLTVTGAGATVLSNYGSNIKIISSTIGRVVDFGTNDLNNMGASMAPAAADSMLNLFSDTNTTPNDYDMIITGDLGKLGSDILRNLMAEQGYALGQNYIDCGCMVYDLEQNSYQGGSGCGCSACVFNSYIIDKLRSGEINSVAYFATGALMSSQSCYQGETIPCISHGIVVRSEKI